jgi:hypothetical protein
VITRPLIVVKGGGNPSVDAAGICADVARLVREVFERLTDAKLAAPGTGGTTR